MRRNTNEIIRKSKLDHLGKQQIINLNSNTRRLKFHEHLKFEVDRSMRKPWRSENLQRILFMVRIVLEMRVEFYFEETKRAILFESRNTVQLFISQREIEYLHAHILYQQQFFSISWIKSNFWFCQQKSIDSKI